MKISYDLDLDRIKFLFSQNPDSPLFARLGDLLGNKGMISEGIKICEEGIKKHRFYISAYLTLSNLYRKNGDLEKAFQTVRNALKISPNCFSAVKLHEELKKILKEKEEKKLNIVEEKDSNEEESELVKLKSSNLPKDSHGAAGQYVIDKIQLDDKTEKGNNIEKIINRLSKAGSLIIKADPNFNKIYRPPKPSNGIITETLFHIYYNQGLFEESLRILRQLLEKNPARSIYYRKKIKEIEEKVELMKSLE